MKLIQHLPSLALLIMSFILPSMAMEQEQIKGTYVHFKRPTTEERSNKDDLIHVTLEKLNIHHTIGNDLGHEEGAVNLTVGDQNTALYWAGYTGKNLGHKAKPFIFPPEKQKSNSKITLFIGKIDKKWLEFHAFVTESDKDDQEKWTRASNVIQALGNTGNLFPPYGTLVSQGANVISQLGRFISTLMHDTQELNYSGNLTEMDTITKGKYTLFRGIENEADIEIVLNVDTFQPLVGAEEVRVILNDVKFPPKLAKRLQNSKELATLEVDVGDEIFRREFLCNALVDKVFKIENIRLYHGKWPGYLPFSASLTCIENSEDVKLKELIKLNSQIRSLKPVGENEVPNKVVGVVDTVSSAVLAGLAPSKIIKFFSVGKTVLSETNKILVPIALYNKGSFIGDIEFYLNIEKLD